MPVKFANESEAFLSVLTLVAGADQSGSLEERDFLFKKVKGLAIFGNPSTADLQSSSAKSPTRSTRALPRRTANSRPPASTRCSATSRKR